MERGKMPDGARRAMLGALGGGLCGCAACGALYWKEGFPWALSAAVACGMVAYHMLVRFLAPVLLWAFRRGRAYDPAGWWFRARPWEAGLYRALGVKKWKGRAITYDPAQFSLRLYTAGEVLDHMCHAELVHELSAVLGLLSVLFAIPFGDLWLFLLTGLLAAGFDGSFAAVQRYNRPRMLRLAGKQAGRQKKDGL